MIDEPAFLCEIRREQLFDFLRRERRRNRGVARCRIRRRGDQKELRDAENTRDEHQRGHEHFDEGRTVIRTHRHATLSASELPELGVGIRREDNH